MSNDITISYSEIDAFRQCPFKHWLAYQMRYTKPAESTSALGKGTFWHRIMDVHYRTIKEYQTGFGAYTLSYDDVLLKCKEAVSALIMKVWAEENPESEIMDLMVWMYRGYIEVYGIDDEWEIIAIEHAAIVPLYDREGNDTGFSLKVKIDLLVRDKNGRLWIVDHKSCSVLPKDDADFSFEEQFGIYTVACRRLGFRVFGSLHSAARTVMNKGDLIPVGHPQHDSRMKAQPLSARFKRTRMNRTDAELVTIEQEILATAQRAYSPDNTRERYPDSDRCRWRCSFTDACLLGRRTNNVAKTIAMLEDSGYTQEFARH